MNKQKIRVGIVGGTGYTGVELLRILVAHPRAELVTITSRQEAGHAVAGVFPSLRGKLDLEFVAPESAPLADCDVVFFATPHGTSMLQAPQLLQSGVRIIDLSADYRLRDARLWQQWYGDAHASPDWLGKAVYGMPEINRDRIRDAQLVSCPGCYPTAVQLALLGASATAVAQTRLNPMAASSRQRADDAIDTPLCVIWVYATASHFGQPGGFYVNGISNTTHSHL